MTRKHPVILGQAEAISQTEAIGDPEKLLEMAEQLCKKLYSIDDKSARRRAISSILKEIRQYAPILDVFTQGAPSVVSICWGAIRVVLEVSIALPILRWECHSHVWICSVYQCRSNRHECEVGPKYRILRTPDFLQFPRPLRSRQCRHPVFLTIPVWARLKKQRSSMITPVSSEIVWSTMYQRLDSQIG
jgi:hypothetical protein